MTNPNATTKPAHPTAPTAPASATLQALPPITPTGFKDVGTAYILLIFLGALGVHRFYLGKAGIGILYLLTGGILGIGVLVDVFTLTRKVRDANRKIDARAF